MLAGKNHHGHGPPLDSDGRQLPGACAITVPSSQASQLHVKAAGGVEMRASGLGPAKRNQKLGLRIALKKIGVMLRRRRFVELLRQPQGEEFVCRGGAELCSLGARGTQCYL